MKKIVASLLLLTFMVSILCGCSIPGRKPTEGLWYCADLGISIDFSLLTQELIPNCAKLYSGEGADVDILCYIDYGTGISFKFPDPEADYFFVGNFTYRNGIFTVTSNEDNKQYTFVRVSDSSTLFWVEEESHFVDYTVNEDQVTFRYAICFINDSKDDVSIKLSAKFHTKDLQGWSSQQDFIAACDENGEWTYRNVPGGHKVVHIYSFSVPYNSGTVNSDISFPDEIILTTANAE